MEPVDQPEPLLGEGEREFGGALRGLQGAAAAVGPFDVRRYPGGGRRLEDRTDGQFDAEGLTDQAQQPDRGE